MLLELAQSKKILFFGGKGGVGKTTVSSATAMARANAGGKVLLVSTDPAHNLGHLFDRKIGSKPVRITAGLDALELDPGETVENHLKEITESLYKLMPVNLHKEIDKHISLSRGAPGMYEAALLERIADVIEDGKDEYDLIVFDTAPSGHTARLMVLPEMMSAWTEGLIKRREKADRFQEFVRELGQDTSMEDKTIGGATMKEQERESHIRRILLRRRRKFEQLREQLSDSDISSFVIVLAAERLPVLETIELQEQLQEANITVECLIVNKRAPANSGEFLDERHAQEEIHLQTLTNALPAIQRQDIYLQPQDVVGIGAVETLAQKL
ncbi:MAG: ArsA family ATPase [Gammaproteobacteria bacterium]|nr:ArsA family ATPase [Gammaproteobacteria bacterium]MDD9894406.1 ArsA family ATPase [Gammaproteobacteria bacterium]MDD9960332.1 ArsA family ATPase [Gammaproteobacteria bacterium]